MTAMNRIPSGYKQTEVGVIPDDWAVKPLNDVVDFLDGRRRPVKDTDRAKMRGSIPYYGASGIVDYVNDYLFDEELILLGEDGENILSRNCRLAFRVSGKVWVNNHAHVLKPKDGNDIGYVADFLESINYEQYNTGTAQPKLNKQVCSSIPVVTPPPAEQRAIATALSDVDALLAAQEKLIAKKRDIKQAAMQQLLSGKYRLLGFSGEWEVKRLGDICGSITTGKLDANAMVASGEYPFFTCAREHYFIDEYAFDADALLVSGNGANVGYVHHYKGKFNAYQRTYVLTDFTAEVVYLRLFMDKNLQERLRTEVNAGNTPYITMDTLTDMSVALPSTREEQAAIAAVLSDMDADLAALEQQRDKTRALKQGMMQELLTGRIRLV